MGKITEALKKVADERIARIQKKPEIQYGPQRLGDLLYFVCDISKARSELKWEPKVTPKDGISKLINWIKDNEGLFSKG